MRQPAMDGLHILKHKSAYKSTSSDLKTCLIFAVTADFTEANIQNKTNYKEVNVPQYYTFDYFYCPFLIWLVLSELKIPEHLNP